MGDDMNSVDAVNMALNWEDLLFIQLQEIDVSIFAQCSHIFGHCYK